MAQKTLKYYSPWICLFVVFFCVTFFGLRFQSNTRAARDELIYENNLVGAMAKQRLLNGLPQKGGIRDEKSKLFAFDKVSDLVAIRIYLKDILCYNKLLKQRVIPNTTVFNTSPILPQTDHQARTYLTYYVREGASDSFITLESVDCIDKIIAYNLNDFSFE